MAEPQSQTHSEQTGPTGTEKAPDQACDQAEETTELPARAEEATQRRAPVDATAPRPPTGDGQSPRLRDVTGTFGDYIRGRAAVIGRFVKTHRLATCLLAVFFVVMLICLALAFSRAASTPSKDEITADARTRVSMPAYDSGAYGPDDVLILRGVNVRSSSRTASAQDSDNAQFGASGYASANVLVEYSGSSVRVEKTATLDYARVDGAWVPIGGEADAQVAWSALAGVDQDKVVAGIGEILIEAEASLGGSGSGAAREMTLASIYADSVVTVEESFFNEEDQTDTLKIRCIKAGIYESYTCELTVTFGFSPVNGRWSVSKVEVADGAKTRAFDPMMGSWSGTFQSQATDGTKCLAGSQGLSITIGGSRSEGSVSQITGTISGLAHYHDHPARDTESSDGDKAFEDVPFTATLVGGHNDATGSDLAFVATLPEEVGGTVTVTLGFGTSDDPGRVVALVQTTYPHTGSFLFIPYEETIVYEDLFTLQKTE